MIKRYLCTFLGGGLLMLVFFFAACLPTLAASHMAHLVAGKQHAERSALPVVPASGFASSCHSFYVINANDAKGVFFATCTNGAGQNVQTSIDLNNYLGNSNGQLVTPGTGFKNTCDSLSIYGTDLNAFCFVDPQNKTMTSFDLNTHLTNNNGSLVWN